MIKNKKKVKRNKTKKRKPLKVHKVKILKKLKKTKQKSAKSKITSKPLKKRKIELLKKVISEKIKEATPLASEEHQQQIKEQRDPIKKIITKAKLPKKKISDKKWTVVGIPGFDQLLEKGIPKGTATIVVGGPGTGKTIFGLQTLYYGATHGEKCIYMTFEESEKRLRQHMRDFKMDPDKLEKEGKLLIKRYDPFSITRQVEAMLEKAKGELLIDVKPVLFPENFKPDRIVLDSLSAISAAFVGKEETYRIYIEQLFRLFEELGATSFLITESNEIPIKISASGVEEFLADGVIIIYNIQRGNIRERAIEILKLRGAQHQKRIVAMEINAGIGLEVYPEQEVFGLETGN